MSDYWKLLKDPQWQRKRLEVMERAGFRCEQCDADKSTLHVHHTYYAKGRKPWEYDTSELLCLCEECHARITDELQEFAVLIGKLDEGDRAVLRGFLRAMVATTETLTKAIQIDDATEAVGVAGYFGIRPSVVDSMRQSGKATPRLLIAEARARYYE